MNFKDKKGNQTKMCFQLNNLITLFLFKLYEFNLLSEAQYFQEKLMQNCKDKIKIQLLSFEKFNRNVLMKPSYFSKIFAPTYIKLISKYEYGQVIDRIMNR